MFGVIVPVFNEKQRAVATVDKILVNTKKVKVIVVDDGSKDSTVDLLRHNFGKNERVYLVEHYVNLGKGAAMRTGIQKAFELGCDSVVFLDGDGQHNPILLTSFIHSIIKNKLVFGYREFDKTMPLYRKLGNIAVRFVMKYLFSIKRKDLLCGYFGFNLSLYKNIVWASNGYGVESEIAAKVGKKKIPFEEIKVDTIYLYKYKGVNLWTAIKILFKIPYWYLTE